MLPITDMQLCSVLTVGVLLVQKFDLIMYGDSIFESLLGSVVGHPVDRAAEIPAVWSRFHQPDTDKIFALAGEFALGNALASTSVKLFDKSSLSAS